ncbi:hypothetical protein BOTBODRAFT_283613 [Botryobasidium botryosum FD-172 SS1]|uniref:Uncharacterized protein n=1 Tax=Botryobasidium botryosum (strain FD-172 SS1) TaxID=930990 RepID=A0A067MIL3_BOTB1|nr:hypothetical protein BOTBODRAFT_283613 [Botryobasidium botryosum FD-172 SS1]
MGDNTLLEQIEALEGERSYFADRDTFGEEDTQLMEEEVMQVWEDSGWAEEGESSTSGSVQGDVEMLGERPPTPDSTESERELARCDSGVSLGNTSASDAPNPFENTVVRLERLVTDYASMESELAEAKARVDELEGAKGEVEQMEQVLMVLEQEKADAVEKNERLLKEMQERESELLSSGTPDSHELESLKARYEELEALHAQARNYVEELNELYNQASNACAAAEARVTELETELLIPLTNPPANEPPSFQTPPEDEAMDPEQVAELLIAVERLRAERNDLRRTLSFSQVESKSLVEMLDQQVKSAHAEAREREQALESLQAELEVAYKRLSILEPTQQELAAVNKDLDLACRQVSRLELLSTGAFTAAQHIQLKLDAAEDALGVSRTSEDALRSTVVQLQAELGDAQGIIGEKEALLAAANEALSASDTQLQTALRACEEAVSGRDRLQSQVDMMEERLEEAEARARGLRRSAQLDSISGAPESVRLRTEIEDLELRILRRNEQIGILQHDIKRLDTNFRILEESNEELSTELATVTSEKKSLLEDCAAAREEREIVQAQVAQLEIEADTLSATIEEKDRLVDALRSELAQEKDAQAALHDTHHVELAATVQAVFENASRARTLASHLASANSALTAATHAHETPRFQLESQLAVEHESHQAALDELELKGAELSRAMAEKADMEEGLSAALSSAQEETQQAHDTITALESDLEARDQEMVSLQEEFSAAVQELESRTQNAESAIQTHLAALESLRTEKEALVKELASLEASSQQILEETTERLSAEIVAAHEDAAQARLSAETDVARLQSTLDASHQAHASLQSQYESLHQEYGRVRQELEARLQEVARQAETAESGGHKTRRCGGRVERKERTDGG